MRERDGGTAAYITARLHAAAPRQQQHHGSTRKHHGTTTTHSSSWRLMCLPRVSTSCVYPCVYPCVFLVCLPHVSTHLTNRRMTERAATTVARSEAPGDDQRKAAHE